MRIMLISDRRQRALEELWAVLPQAARAGLTDVMIREKDLAGGPLLSLVQGTLAHARPAGVRVIVNDRLDVALAAGADGAHLGVAGIPVAEARRFLGPKLTLGASTHNLAELRAAQEGGADYATFGPVFATASKAAYGPPLGVEALCEAVRSSSMPVLALGGITADRARELGGSGIAGVAAIGALLADAAFPAGVGAIARVLETA